MKYKTSDLSKMLSVSDNTIRRFAEKGYLSPIRGEDNQYRYYGNEDVEKITYISKYRKIGFGHDEIGEIFQSDLSGICSIYEQKREELRKEIERLKYLRHMLKDNIGMMKNVAVQGDDFIEMDSVPVYYVPYKTEKKIRNDTACREAVQHFLYDFPEIEYIYIIKKEDILSRNLRQEEAIAVSAILADKRNYDVSDAEVRFYPKQWSIMKVVRVPLDFSDEAIINAEEIKKLLYDDFLDYMKEKEYELAGDAFGAKIGYSKENGQEMQYIILGMPVEKKK